MRFSSEFDRSGDFTWGGPCCSACGVLWPSETAAWAGLCSGVQAAQSRAAGGCSSGRTRSATARWAPWGEQRHRVLSSGTLLLQETSRLGLSWGWERGEPARPLPRRRERMVDVPLQVCVLQHEWYMSINDAELELPSWALGELFLPPARFTTEQLLRQNGKSAETCRIKEYIIIQCILPRIWVKTKNLILNYFNLNELHRTEDD